MIRINIPWIINVSTALEKLSLIESGKSVKDAFFLLYGARYNVSILFDSIYNQHIRVSRPKSQSLIDELDRLINKNEDEIISDMEKYMLINTRDEYSQLLFAEFSSMPAYFVSRKEGYDVEALVDQGIMLFPASLVQKAPETERDAFQAGKALAFEIATGCGFHVFRVTESVVRGYWDEVSHGAKRPKLQTLGNFAIEMEKRNIGDSRIVESIKQMNRLHRNPIIHPDVILTVEEAIGIVGIARSVVGAMLAVLPDVPPTTSMPQSIVGLYSDAT